LHKTLKHAITLFVGLLVGAGLTLGILCLCGQDAADRLLFGCCGEDAAAAEVLESTAVRLAYDAAAAIRDGDFESLGELVHPELGLIITPYSTVNLASDQWFTAAETAKLGGDTTGYIWGADPVTGAVLELPAGQFFSRHMYDFDYASASVACVNAVAKQGNALENVSAVFPDAIFVDLHNPGHEEQWSTLRLVFEPDEGELRLVALIHSAYSV